MRPLHSLLLLVGLIVLVSAAWLTLHEVQPAAPAVAPAASGTPVPERVEQPDVVAVAPTGERAQRTVEALPAQPQEPAPEVRGVPADGGNALRGLVLGPAGEPVAGARVLAAPGSALGLTGIPLDALDDSLPFARRVEARTDAKGRFELRGTQPGELRLAVRAAGFAPWDKDDVIVPAGGDHELAPIELERGAILTGRVVDPDGRAIAGAELARLVDGGLTVIVSGTGARGSPLATTATDGSFTIDQLAAGSFRLVVTHPDHPDHVENGRTERPGERLDGLTIVMEHGLTISGRVTGAPEGALEDLVVRAVPERLALTRAAEQGGLPPESREAVPAGDGSFLVRGTRAGHSYELVARRRTSSPGLAGLLGTSLSPRVPASAGDHGVELPYQPSGALVFQVVDASTRAPVTEFEARAGVNFLMPLIGDDGRTLRDHPEGRARFGNLRPKSDERVQLAINAVGYREARLDELMVPVGGDTDLGTIALEPVPLVEVTVLDDATGSPVPGARVTLREPPDEPAGHMRMTLEIEAGDDGPGDVVMEADPARTATADEQGVARVSSLEGRLGILRVSHPDFAPLESEPFVSPPDDVDRHVLRLMEGGTVAITVTTPDGAPLAGARIEHQAPDEDGFEWSFGRGASPVTDAEGRAVFAHLAAGRHRFRPAGTGGGGMGFMGAGGSVVRMRRSGGPAEAVDEGWREVAVSEGGQHELALVAPLRVTLSGVVYEGGRPLEGAKLSLKEPGDERDPLLAAFGGGGPETRTDGRGQYVLENVESGEYTLEITHPTRRMPASFDLSVADQDLTRDYDLVVSVLQGRVTDEEGEPLVGVRLSPERASQGDRPRATVISVMAFSDQDGGGEVVTVGDGSLGAVQATTDEDGRYELRGVEPDVDLVVRAEGDSVQPGQSEVVRVAPDQTRAGVDITLAAAGRIEVQAFKPDGKPASMLMVTAVFEGEGDGGRKSGLIQDSGRYTLEGLAPGPWRVALRSVGGLSGSGSAEPIPDQLVDVVVGETASAQFSVP